MNLIYIHKNIINDKIYIGRTKLTMERRLRSHIITSNSGSQTPFHRALRKYGIENFNSDVLEVNIPNEIIKERERYWIENYDSFKYGYNSTKGGEGKDGYVTPKEVKKKIRDSHMKVTGSGRTVAQETYIKRTQTILSNNLNGLMEIGEKSGLTQKKNGGNIGKNNPNSKIIEIYDNENNHIITCEGNFKLICQNLGLPERVLIQSHQKGGKVIYSTNKTPNKLKINKYKGWYAIKKK